MRDERSFDQASKEVVVESPSSKQVVSDGTIEGKVYSVSVSVDGGKPEAMMVKEFHTMTESTDAEVKRMKRVHNLLRFLGIPTLKTFMQFESEPKKVYMSDETEGGRYEVFSLTDFWDNPDGKNGRLFNPSTMPDPNVKREDGDKYLYRQLFEISNPDELEEQVSDMMDKCVRGGVELGHVDVFFVAIDKSTKKAKVILGDLGFVYESTPDQALSLTPMVTKSFYERLPLVAKIKGSFSSGKVVQKDLMLKTEFGN